MLNQIKLVPDRLKGITQSTNTATFRLRRFRDLTILRPQAHANSLAVMNNWIQTRDFYRIKFKLNGKRALKACSWANRGFRFYGSTSVHTGLQPTFLGGCRAILTKWQDTIVPVRIPVSSKYVGVKWNNQGQSIVQCLQDCTIRKQLF